MHRDVGLRSRLRKKARDSSKKNAIDARRQLVRAMGEIREAAYLGASVFNMPFVDFTHLMNAVIHYSAAASDIGVLQVVHVPFKRTHFVLAMTRKQFSDTYPETAHGTLNTGVWIVNTSMMGDNDPLAGLDIQSCMCLDGDNELVLYRRTVHYKPVRVPIETLLHLVTQDKSAHAIAAK